MRLLVRFKFSSTEINIKLPVKTDQKINALTLIEIRPHENTTRMVWKDNVYLQYLLNIYFGLYISVADPLSLKKL